MSKFTGNIIRLPAVTPTQNSASGVYTLDDQFTAQSSGTWPIVRDQYFNYTTLLLTGAVQGTAYPNPVTQPYSFLSDASTNNFVVSPNGDVSARPFNPYLNNYSNRFDGSSGQLAFPTGSFVFGNSDFTIEAWVYNIGTTTGTFFNNQYTSGASTTSIIGAIGSASANFDMYVGSSIYSLTGINPALNQWVHLAIVRTGGTVSVFQNGTRTNTRSDLSTLSINAGGTTVAPQIGNGVNGYISNHRIIIGSGPYDATQTSITVPTVPLTAITNTKLLTCQANRFIDTNTQVAAKTITVTGTPAVAQNSPFVSYDTTNGSGYFDGTGDFLQVANNAAFGSLNGVDYTIEFWAYLTTISGDQPLLACTAIGASGFAVWSLSGQLTAFFGSGTTITGSTLTANQWNHIAIVRTSTNTQLYLNGTTQGTPSTSAFGNNTTQPLMIGGLTTTTGWNSDRYATAYITGVRIIKSQALATGNFTPPTTPPTITTVGWIGGNVPTQSITGTVSIYTLQTRAPATNNGFIDSSPNNFVVTRNGNTTQGSFSPFSPTGWGAFFDGSNDYINNSTLNSTYTGDFTFEAWVYFNAFPGNAHLFGQGSETTNRWIFGVTSAGRLFANPFGSSDIFFGSNGDVTTGSWLHIAFVRSGSGSNNITGYVNGVSKGTSTSTATVGNSGGFGIGAGHNGSGPVSGYMSNVRYTAQALYTGAFTPATSPLTTTSQGASASNVKVLTLQNNRFVDNAGTGVVLSANNGVAIQAFSPFAPAQSYIPSQIGGSGYFDGTGDYLNTGSNTALNLGTGDFTWEFWTYLSGTESDGNTLFQPRTPAGIDSVLFGYKSGSNYSIYATTNGSSWNLFSNTTIIAVSAVVNRWAHWAFVRNGSVYSVYVDGVLRTSATNASSISQLTNVFTFMNAIPGYMSNFRFVKGQALATGAFTPPASLVTTSSVGWTGENVPTQAITGSVNLLLNFTNGGIVDATGKNNLETVANSSVQTSQAKWSPGSMYFDGTGDELYFPSDVNFDLGTTYTIECWIYPNSVASNAGIILRGLYDTAGAGTWTGLQFSLRWLAGVGLRAYFFGTTLSNEQTITSSSTALVANQWQHVAMVRNGTNGALYVDGVSVGTISSLNTPAASTQPIRIANFKFSSGDNYYNGYIDDLRITKGIARYTSNFTPPTGPFPLG